MTSTTITTPPPLLRRVYGLGSIFGKTIRDSRRATILVGVVLGLVLIGVSRAIVAEFDTAESRQELGNIVRAVPPILQGLAGRVVNVETLGGYLQYKYGTFFPLVASLWSILALSGTLADEARRGSLEFVAATPLSRRRIALEKLSGHVLVLAIASVLIFVALLVVGSFVTLPGDELPISAAAAYALWLGLLALVAGGLAFALSQFLGRGAAVGIAGAVTFGGFILNGYQNAIPGVAPFANLTWFGWTTNHIPLAGLYDWLSLALVAALAVALLVAGIEAFARRDLGATSAIRGPSLPRALIGLNGPSSRVAGQNLSAAVSWAIGLGLFGLLIAGSAGSFVEQLGESPEFERLLGSIFPGLDVGTVGGFLQLLFLEFGLILAGLAASSLVGGWASDESSGRLEFLLATPLTRRWWVTSGGIGILIGIVTITAVTTAGVAVGTGIAGGEVGTPVLGALSLGLYAFALGGIGIAIAGVVGGGIAAPAVAILTVVTWFMDHIAPALGLPGWVRDLAITSHYGFPMLGDWDPVGIVTSLVLGVGGVAVGAWGFRRRDLKS